MNKKLKIIYFIGSIYKDGGHFHSLATLMTALNNKADISVVSIGFNELYQFKDFKHYNVFWKGSNTISVLFKLIKHLKKEKPDVIHAYDYITYLFAKICGDILNIKTAMTKCGGPSKHYRYPIPDNLILFSHEDMNFYRNHPNYSKTKLYFMPNRVLPFETSEKIEKEVREKIGADKKIVMRITRFSPFYKKSIEQTINLTKLLNDKYQNNYHCVLIGTVQSEKEYEAAKNEGGNILTILKDKEFTDNAKKCLGAADIVVGTGRGLMEAAQKEKILFVPSEVSEYPIPFCEKYFDKLFEMNFSTRNGINVKEDEVLKFIDNSEEIKSFIKEKYEKYFDINSATYNYICIISNMMPKRFFKFLYNVFLVARESKNVFFHVYKKAK